MRLGDQLKLAGQLAGALRSQWWSRDRIRAFQGAALVEMMRYAVVHVPYYRRLGLPAEDLRRAEDLQRFPLIRKRDLQEEPAAFLAEGHDPAGVHASRTSGSCGQPTTTYFDRESWLLMRYALKMRRVVATSGVPLLRRVLIVSEQPEEQLAALERAAPGRLGLFYSLRYVSIHTPAEQHIDEFERYRPQVIYAFPSYLLDLVDRAERLRRPLPRIPVLSTSSEVLTAAARRRIEAAFRGRLFDVYGSTEFKEVAWQCRSGRYHLNFESVYVERPAAGRSGPLVLSTLCNRAMPLLRFDVGDAAFFGGERCACGRESLCLDQITGRESEMIDLPSGRRLSPYLLTTAIEASDLVRTYRIVQTSADAFRVDVVLAGPPAPGWQGHLCTELTRIVAEPARFTVRLVDAIERAPGGKRAAFVRADCAAH